MPDLKVLAIQEGRLQARPDFEMSFDNAGQMLAGPTFIEGPQVAIQDTIRGLLTLITSNRLAPNFGTSLHRIVGNRNINQIADSLSSETQRTMGYLAQVNADSDPSERIAEIVNMKVRQAERSVEIDLVVRTATGQVTAVTVS